ncbi:MAG: transglycosylase domain-containing protein [Bradymonadales bacterium]|nr:transglycosylase domain-containing protein [Bradymonadales bacterium]
MGNRTVKGEAGYPPPAHRPVRRHRRLVVVIVVLASLALLAGAGYLVAMRWARQELTRRLQEVSARLGMQLQWEEMEISLRGSVTLRDLQFRTLRNGRLEGRIDQLAFGVSPKEAWNHQLPDEIRLGSLTVRLDEQGVRSLRPSPAESPAQEGSGLSRRDLPRIQVDLLDAVADLNPNSSLACHGEGVSVQAVAPIEVKGRFDCRAPELGLATGLFDLELNREQDHPQMPWQVQMVAHQGSRLAVSTVNFGSVIASFGARQALVRLETVQLDAPLPGSLLTTPPRVTLEQVVVELVAGQQGWSATELRAGPGEILLALPAAAVEEVAEPVVPDEETEAVALEEAASADSEAVPVLIDWAGIEASLQQVARYLDRLLGIAGTSAEQLVVGGIDLVLARGTQPLLSARLDSLTLQQGEVMAALTFADQPIDLRLESTPVVEEESTGQAPMPRVMLSLEARQVDLNRVSRALGYPKLLQGLVDLTAQLHLGASPSLDLSVDLPDLVVAHPGISPLRLELLPFHWELSASLVSANRRPVSVQVAAALGEQIRSNASLLVSERLGTTQVDLDLHIDESTCRNLLDAIPRGLFIHFPPSSVRIAGRTGLDAHVRYRLGDHRSFRLSLPEEEGFPGTCEITGLPAGYRPEVLLSNSYRHLVPLPYATEEIWVGPGTASYRRLEDLPPYVPAIMYLTEQRGFYEDPVVSASRISKAVRVNLIYGRWAFGGSTIAQQLVKNLFLDRGKTLARKLEEAIIAWEMGEVVGRDRILELYVNCIEFAPNTFGIEAGAQYYFGIHANQLSPIQAAWLAGLKPSPRSGERHRQRGHSPTSGRWPRRLRNHLQLLADRGFIDPDYVSQQAPYVVHFIDPDDPQPLYNPYYRIEILE